LSIQLISTNIVRITETCYQVLYGTMKSYLMNMAILCWKDCKTQDGGVLLAADDNIPSYVYLPLLRLKLSQYKWACHLPVLFVPAMVKVFPVWIWRNIDTTVVSSYIPPNSNWEYFDHTLLCLYQEFIRRTKSYHYYGGLLPDINWSSLSGSSV